MKIKSTKLLAILLAVCMMFSFSSVVFAANLPAMPAGGIDEIFGIYADLKIEEKLGLLHDVQETLKNSTVENETLSSFNKFYDEITDVLEEKDIKIEDLKNLDETELKVLEEDEELKKLMSKDKVTEVAKDTKADVEKAKVDVMELTGVVADAVIESDAIKPEQKVDLVEKVMENIGGAEVGGVAIPEKLLKVYEKVATYLDDQGKLKLMKQVTKLLDENASYPEIAKEIYAILSASEKFTLSAIVDIVEYVFTDVYNEEISKIYADAYDRAQNAGLIEKAVTALELAYSKLGKVTTVVEGIVTDQNELKKALLDEIDRAKVSFKKVIDLLNDANSSFNDVLGLEDELKAHLVVVKNLSYELSKEDLAKLIDDVRALYDAALATTYTTYQICGGEHVYVALGGSETFGAAYVDHFEAALNAKLTENKEEDGVVTDKLVCRNLAERATNVSAKTVVEYVTKRETDIGNANIITFNMGAVDTLLAFALDKNTPVTPDEWADYLDPDTIALAEKAIAKLNVILAEEYDAKTIENIELIAENLVYAVVSYGVETYKALETIVGFNNKAQIAIIGMANPFVNVSINGVPFEGIFDRVIEATDIYNGIYAMFSDKVTFVSVSDVKPANATPVELSLDDPAFATKMMNLLTTNSELKYSDEVVKNLLEAVSLNGDHSWDDTNSNRWVCTVCGETKTTTTPVPGPVPSGPSAPVHFNCDGGENCYCNKYTDLDNTMWYHQGVCYMIKHGYMIGIGDGKWAPEQIITRAEIATILWRIAGSEVVDYALDFSDVEADMWYTEAIEWAVSEEIFLGYGDGKFGPNDQITREQMVTVMYRYEIDNGKKLTADFDMTTVSDADEISDWALEAMTWALDCGLIIGTDVDVLTASPLKTATRAEVAMIFYRKLDNLLK